VRQNALELREDAPLKQRGSELFRYLLLVVWPNQSRQHTLDEGQPVRKLMLQRRQYVQQDQDE
jgi:hypothetical protein